MKEDSVDVDRLLNNLVALPERRMLLLALVRYLKPLTDDAAASVLNRVYSKSLEDERYRRVYAVLVDPDALTDAIGARRSAAIRRAAAMQRATKVCRLFSNPSPHKKDPYFGYEKEEEVKMDHFTLGERRSMSKATSKNVIDRLLSDPDPMVIGNILDNPRVTEKDILKVASKRPASPKILRLLATHKVWSKRYAVIKALVLNPYTQPRISVVLMESLMIKDIEDIVGDGNLHPEVISCAVEILDARRRKTVTTENADE